MDIIENWHAIKDLFKKTFKSSFHFSVATVNEDGTPHISPIGSLILGKPGKAIYFEEFTHKLPACSQHNKRICVLAVNSSKIFWIKSLLLGNFSTAPSVRLYGELGARREATETEIMLWQKRVKSVSFTKGHSMMWANMKMVRELEFDRAEPVNMGRITKNIWRNWQAKNA